MNIKYLKFNEIDSTNLYLKENYQSLDNWTIVEAKYQSAGRGRYTRKFLIDYGKGLIESILLKEEFAFQNADLISIMIGAALSKTLESYGVRSSIKWPNDVLVNDKKISGILLEGVSTSKMEALILGIGININQDTFPKELDHAISLKMVINKETSIDNFSDLFNGTFIKLYESFKNNHDKSFIDYLNSKLAYKNEEVYGEVNGEKRKIKILKIEDDGCLLVVDNEKLMKLRSGELSFHGCL